MQRQALSRFLTYLLGHRPDEFGLVSDPDGFMPLKDVLMALKEEEGWSFVRQSHIEDLLRDPDRTRFEVKDKLIRVVPEDSSLEPGPYPAARPPALLYHAARPRAYPVILERGLRPGARPFVPLFVTPEMALRVGRRRDPKPVLLTIQAARAAESGVVFYRPQELIYLVDLLAPDFLTGPPLPKEKPAPKEAPRPEPPHPGSFFLDAERDLDRTRRPPKKGKRKKGTGEDWKRASRKMRRERNR